jgi:hypothetical protein
MAGKFQFTLLRMMTAMFLVACACVCLQLTLRGHETVALVSFAFAMCFVAAAWGMLAQGWDGSFKAAFIMLLGIFWLPLVLFSCVAVIFVLGYLVVRLYTLVFG